MTLIRNAAEISVVFGRSEIHASKSKGKKWPKTWLEMTISDLSLCCPGYHWVTELEKNPLLLFINVKKILLPQMDVLLMSVNHE